MIDNDFHKRLAPISGYGIMQSLIVTQEKKMKTYREMTKDLLSKVHPLAQAHYRARFAKFIRWHRAHGMRVMPDAADEGLERSKKIASYRRLYNVLAKGDFFCVGLSFSATKAAREVLSKIEADGMKLAA